MTYLKFFVFKFFDNRSIHHIKFIENILINDSSNIFKKKTFRFILHVYVLKIHFLTSISNLFDIYYMILKK